MTKKGKKEEVLKTFGDMTNLENNLHATKRIFEFFIPIDEVKV